MRKYLPTKIASYIGLVVQAVVNNFLPILFVAFQDIYGLSYEQLARIIVFNFVTQIITDLLTPKILNVLGYRGCAVMCQGTAALGLIMLGILPRVMGDTYTAIVISVVIYAFGSGLMEVALSPLVESLPSSNKKGSMAILHSFYCWGQAFTVLVTTALVALLGYGNWTYIPLIWAVIPSINMLSFLKVPIVEPPRDQKKDSFKTLFKNSRFRLYMIMMLAAGASEIAMAQWSSLFAQRALGVTKLVGDLAGPCAFAIFMGSGRIWYATVAKRVSFKKTLIWLNAGAFICYIAVAVLKIEFLSLVFCALCGFTVSISWPGIYSAGARDFPNGSAVMYSVFAMCGDMGCTLGPWVLGIVADNVGLNLGFAAAAVFPLVMILATALIIKKDCKLKENVI